MSLQIFLLLVSAIILAAVWYVGVHFGILWAGLCLLLMLGTVIGFIAIGGEL